MTENRKNLSRRHFKSAANSLIYALDATQPEHIFVAALKDHKDFVFCDHNDHNDSTEAF